jgi:HlyD family secretion protein
VSLQREDLNALVGTPSLLRIELAASLMARRTAVPAILIALLLLATAVWSCRNGESSIDQTPTATVARRALKVMVSTNGVIEPVDRSEIFAPIDAIVAHLPIHEGDEVAKGQLLARLDSNQLKTALVEARAALLQARRQAQPVLAGSSPEELAPIEASLAGGHLQLQQAREELRREEALLKESATTRVAVENLRERVKVLEAQLKGLKEKKEGLLNRYTAKEREWELKRIAEMEQQVQLIEQQLAAASLFAPHKGVVYFLPVKPGLFVAKGQVLTQIFVRGQVRLRAYVDEPDLGRIERGQETLIEWDGLPGKAWRGTVERPAETVVTLGNRSVGYAICSIEGTPKELIPNSKVSVQIVTAQKADALVVPRAAVFNHGGRPTVIQLEGNRKVYNPVTLGLATPQEIEILEGLKEGNRVMINPGEAATR